MSSVLGMMSGGSSRGGGSSLGNFGPVVFTASSECVRTIESLSRQARAVFADHPVVMSKPVTEFTGHELDEVTFPMTFNAGLGVTPLDEVEALREILLSAEPQDLNIGGTSYGSFTLREIGEQVTHFFRGDPYIIEVDVTVKEYIAVVADGTQAADAAARGQTGKGGPKRVAGGKSALRNRTCTPAG